MKFLKIKKFADLVGVSVQALRDWDTKDKLKPHHISPGGHRYYSVSQLGDVLGPNYLEDLSEDLKDLGAL